LFKIKKTGEKPKSADFRTYNLKYTNIQLNEEISVSVDGTLVSTGYSVDYINGIILFESPLTSTSVVSVDYYYCPINIYIDGESPSSPEFKYPAIAIYEADSKGVPIELGSSKKERYANWVLEIWTDRGGENSDIKDTLMDFFDEELNIIDYNVDFPINRDGSKNTLFDADANTIGFATCESINSAKSGSLDIGDKPKYLNEIFVELKINS
jgi:hypothetical protein